MEHWSSRIQNLSRFPKLELYQNIKNGFHFETYLDLVKDSRYRNAITKIRSSSHPLEIERGRYTKPKTPRSNRLCSRCKVIEDERHFILDCTLYKEERHIFLGEVSNKNPMFPALTVEEKNGYLLASKDAQIFTWLGKFLYHIFDKRNKYLIIIGDFVWGVPGPGAGVTGRDGFINRPCPCRLPSPRRSSYCMRSLFGMQVNLHTCVQTYGYAHWGERAAAGTASSPLRVLRAGKLDGSPGLLRWRCCHGGGFPLQYARACFLTHSF